MTRYKAVGLFDSTHKLEKKIEEMSKSEIAFALRECYSLPKEWEKMSDESLRQLLTTALESGLVKY
jgi:hypothetical protein